MLKYLIIDVDGTFTDGGIYYDENGNETKKFCTKDGTGIVCARMAGIQTIVLTGRECGATLRRMTELKLDQVYQNVTDKTSWVKEWIKGKRREQVGYIGDDVNDLASMEFCGYVGCPADAAEDVKRIANYVSKIRGGHGAVRDVIEHYLRDKGIWLEIINKVYGTGI